MSDVARSRTRVAGFANPELDFQLLRQLGSAPYGGASVGQCLALARRIGEGGPEAWVQAFAELARDLEADGKRRADKGHAVSARDMLLMASNAWRAAEYFCPVDMPAHAAMGFRSRQCFQAAMAHMPHAHEALVVPLDGMGLPACFLKHRDPEPRQRPTLIAVSGYDGTMEETYLQVGRAALERGYNVCLFAGPGQMDSLRFAPGLCFQPDYERPVSALLDQLLQRPEVDADRVGLCGFSIGGYFAPRGAAYDSRIRALIANSPVVDYHKYMCGLAGFDPLRDLGEEQDFGIEDLREIPDEEMPPYLKEMSRSLMLRFGQPTFKAVFKRLQDFSLLPVLERISCPCLAMAGAGEGDEVLRQLDVFCKGVSGPAQRRIFTEQQGADSHCQIGNMQLAAAEALDWLDEVFS